MVGANGLDTNAVISNIGNAVNSPTFSLGCKFSPDGSRFAAFIGWLATSNGVPDSIEIYDFDNNSGLLTNRRTFNDFPQSEYLGMEFSKNSRYFYMNVSPWSNVIGDRAWTLRYDCILDTFGVLDSIYPVFPYTYLNYACYSLNLDQNDNLIKGRNSQDSLDIIHNASSVNAYSEAGWMGLQGRTNRWCLPNFISNYFGYDPATTGKPDDVFYHGDESFCVKAFQLMKVDFLQSTITLPYFFREGQIQLSNLKGEILLNQKANPKDPVIFFPTLEENIVLVTLIDENHTCTQKYSQNK